MPASKTLRDITGLGHVPGTIGKSALILIDCQNTYREGLMQLEGVEPALVRMPDVCSAGFAMPAVRSFTSSTMRAPDRLMT